MVAADDFRYSWCECSEGPTYHGWTQSKAHVRLQEKLRRVGRYQDRAQGSDQLLERETSFCGSFLMKSEDGVVLTRKIPRDSGLFLKVCGQSIHF